METEEFLTPSNGKQKSSRNVWGSPSGFLLGPSQEDQSCRAKKKGNDKKTTKIVMHENMRKIPPTGSTEAP